MFKKIALTLLITLTSLFGAEKFDSIEFEGLTQISKSVALENIKFKNENSYTAEEINNAIKEFYKFSYFKDIWTTNNNKVLTFHFKEKPFISKLEVVGYKTQDYQLEEVYKMMNIKKGSMYTKRRVNQAKKALLIALEREGFVNSVVEVETEPVNENSVAVTFNVNKGEEIIIKKITYKGAEVLDESDFEEGIANKEEDCCFTWFFGMNEGEMNYEQLGYDSARIKNVYLENGYLDAKVSAAFSKIDFNTHNADIEYTITEGEQYFVNETLIYIDESIAKSDEIYPELKLEKGDVFNITHLKRDQKLIKTKVANQGYAFAEIKFDLQPDKKTKKVNIVYNVIPGDKVYINDVIITGNSKTLDRVIRRNVYLAPGDLFNLTDFDDSKNTLGRTGYFENVTIEQKRVSSDKVDLLVNVTETATGNLIFGGGYGSYEGFMLNMAVNDKNIFGSGLTLGTSIDYSKKNTSFDISLFNPAINDSIYNGFVKVFREKSELNSYNDSADDREITETGMVVGSGRSLTRHSRIGLNYELTSTDVKYDEETTDNQNKNYITSALTPYISFNNTDDYRLPRKGIIAGTSLKFAGVGGDSKYLLSNTNFKFFYGLEDLIDYDMILRYKTNVKVLIDQGEIPEGTTFYMGGPTNLRGYESYAFNPDDYDAELFDRVFTNTFEMNFPLIPSAKMRWGLFYDYGMIGEDNFTDIKRSGYGALLSWDSPVGPLQFIFSQPVDDEPDDNTSSFEFNLGGKF